jgi:hypothetical protein
MTQDRSFANGNGASNSQGMPSLYFMKRVGWEYGALVQPSQATIWSVMP